MASNLRISIKADGYQRNRLEGLQALFARACNAIAEVVRETHCWNRVALHHLVYRRLRSEFPELGSQMACNVIYSVCRAARSVYQHPESPWRVKGHDLGVLPLIHFRATAPVYFDRHTLSLRGGMLSLFTLDGRMKFSVDLAECEEKLFVQGKLKEVSLVKSSNGFELHFAIGDKLASELGAGSVIPEYIFIQDPEVSVIAERQLGSLISSVVKAAM